MERPDQSLAVRELAFLQRLAHAAASTQDSDELLQLIIREATQAMGVDVCSLYLVDAGGEHLLLTATNGLNERMVGQVRMRVGEGITGSVAAGRQPAVVGDVSRDPRWKWVPGLDDERFDSMLSVPIESGPRLVGVVNAQSVQSREFSDGDIEFMRAIAAQVAGILERSELLRRVEAQLAEIRSSHDIHERFTRLSLEGAGIPAIVETIGVLAGGRAALYTADGFRVRGAGADRLPSRVAVPPALASGGYEARASAGKPPRDLDLVAVRAGPDLLGLLAVETAEGGAAGPESRRRALQHGSTVLALELSKERAAAEVERRLRGDLVEQLLAGGLEADESERLARQAERLGHSIPTRAWVVVAEPDDPAAEGELAARVRQDRLDVHVSDLIRRRAPGSLVLVRATSVVVLLPEDAAPELRAAESLAAALQQVVGPQVRPGTVSVGIGNLAAGVEELARSHIEARQALRLSRRAGGGGRITTYRSLGAFRLLLEVQSPEVLRGFVDEVLGPLLRYSGSRDTPLLETLEALVDERWIRRAAARRLGIHINSMTYRVQRIEQLSGLSLDEPEARVAVAIAVRARAMLG